MPAEDAMQHVRFAQILVQSCSTPKVDFGDVILGRDRYAVSYEDGSRKIPEWAKLRLSQHQSIDMHGNPRDSYMILLRGHEQDHRTHLDDLVSEHEKDGMAIAAVHDVRLISEQGNSNGKGRVIRHIKPSQELYYSCSDPAAAGFSKNLDAFRQALIRRLQKAGSHDSLHDFKHVVQVVKRSKRQEYKYSLPSDLPAAFLDGLWSVELNNIEYGNKVVNLTFALSERDPYVLPFRPRSSRDPKDTGIVSAYRNFVLHTEQGYLQEYMRSADAHLVHFDMPSTTCKEKCELLNSAGGRKWSLDNIISAHYFDGPNGYIVLVGPRLWEIAQPESLISKAIGGTVLGKSESLPDEMEHGTCTPFVRIRTGKDIDRFVLLDLPRQIMDEVADYSIGGRGPSAHCASIQMAQKLAKVILMRQFEGKVISVQHPYEQYR